MRILITGKLEGYENYYNIARKLTSLQFKGSSLLCIQILNIHFLYELGVF